MAEHLTPPSLIAVTHDDDMGWLHALPFAMILADDAQHIHWMNAPAEALLGTSLAHATAHSLADYLSAAEAWWQSYRTIIAERRTYSWRSPDIKPLQEQHIHTLSTAPYANQANLHWCILDVSTEPHHTAGSARHSTAMMASVLAHEIKNPLSGIRGAAQLLQNQLEDDRLAQLICNEVDRISGLLDNLSVFSAPHITYENEVNIHEVLTHSIEVARHGFAQNIDWEIDYDPSLPELAANRDMLVQVFINLFKNAAEALQATEAPRIHITTRYQHAPRAQDDISSKPKPGLLVRVEDNGPGIAEDIAASLFDPFISTKEQNKGLGLAIVAKIIEDHGGVIRLNGSRELTCFDVILPS